MPENFLETELGLIRRRGDWRRWDEPKRGRRDETRLALVEQRRAVVAVRIWLIGGDEQRRGAHGLGVRRGQIGASLGSVGRGRCRGHSEAAPLVFELQVVKVGEIGREVEISRGECGGARGAGSVLRGGAAVGVGRGDGRGARV